MAQKSPNIFFKKLLQKLAKLPYLVTLKVIEELAEFYILGKTSWVFVVESLQAFTSSFYYSQQK